MRIKPKKLLIGLPLVAMMSYSAYASQKTLFIETKDGHCTASLATIFGLFVTASHCIKPDDPILVFNENRESTFASLSYSRQLGN